MRYLQGPGCWIPKIAHSIARTVGTNLPVGIAGKAAAVTLGVIDVGDQVAAAVRPVTNRLAPSPPVSVSALPPRSARLRPVTLLLHPWPALPSNLARVPRTGCQQAACAQDRLFSQSPAKAPCSAST